MKLINWEWKGNFKFSIEIHAICKLGGESRVSYKMGNDHLNWINVLKLYAFSACVLYHTFQTIIQAEFIINAIWFASPVKEQKKEAITLIIIPTFCTIVTTFKVTATISRHVTAITRTYIERWMQKCSKYYWIKKQIEPFYIHSR